MTARERAYGLLREYRAGRCPIEIFSDQFSNAVYLDLREDECGEEEYQILRELAFHAMRYSDDPSAHEAFPDGYLTRAGVDRKVEEALAALRECGIKDQEK